MQLRTVYFKVVDIASARTFWGDFLGLHPHKDFDDWCEFMIGGLRFAILKLDEAESGNACVPVFQLDDALATRRSVARAVELGAKVFLDGLDDPDVRSVVLTDPIGNQFELTILHD